MKKSIIVAIVVVIFSALATGCSSAYAVSLEDDQLRTSVVEENVIEVETETELETELETETEAAVKTETEIQETQIVEIVEVQEETEEVVEEEVVEERTEVSIIGCSVRTYADSTSAYETADDVAAITYISKDTKLVVTDEENGRFSVEYEDQQVWISTEEVLVNIAYYIPTLSIDLSMALEENYFNMAGESIEGLTNHQFYTAEGSVNGTEAWLKYSVAQKLAAAQETFLADGYSIVIYDAYRPYSVTLEFKDAYSTYLSTKTAEFKNTWFGELGESWFLAQKASSHNYGVAVDMSLKNVETGEIVAMPSAIHTLDCTSALYVWQNAGTEESEMALYMKSVMEGTGFASLKSEWWHFQLNEAKTDIIDIAN